MAEDPAIQRISVLVLGTVEWARRFGRENDFKPADPSQARRELVQAEEIGLAPLVSGNYFIGQRHLQAAAGFAESFVRLMGIEGGAYGPQALARASLEGAARVKWLFDSQIDAMERLARGLVERIDSLQEVRKLSHEQQERSAIDARLLSIEAFAGKAGVAPLGQRPRATELIEALFDVSGVGAPNFRDLSFAIHGRTPALIAEMALDEADIRLETILHSDIPAASAVRLGALLFLGAINAIDAERAFFAWEASEWIEWRRTSTAELAALAGRR